MLEVAVVFILTTLVDWLWAEWTKAVADMRIVLAPVLSSLIWLAGGYVTVEYTQNMLMLIPAVLGCFVGTFISVWNAKRKQAKQGRPA